jgi:N-acetylmuramoyl-L-alanine amidase
MAKWHTRFMGGGVLLLLGLGGCQQYAPSVTSLPPPSFSAPKVDEAPAPPAPAMVMVAPPPLPLLPPIAIVPTVPRSLFASDVPRDWVPPVAPRPWRWIVIHHSATTTGGAAAFDRMHRAKGWDELGYDFVIGNGTDTRDGQIEVGPRWVKQKYGAHAKTPDNRYNEYGIGICLVGNFQVDRPSAAQMRSLVKLSAYLMRTYHITPDRVLGHRDTKATECPGQYTDIAMVRRQAGVLAGLGAYAESAEPASGTELLVSDKQ